MKHIKKKTNEKKPNNFHVRFRPGMDDYIAHLIERRDISELKIERKGIHDRGGRHSTARS